MNKSGSRGDIASVEGGFLKESGVDLSEYKQQLAKERNARTLTLRQIQRPMLKSIFTVKDMKPKARVSFNDDKQAIISSCVAIFEAGEESGIASFCNGLIDNENPSVSQISTLAKSPDVASAICQAFTSGNYSDNTMILLLGALSTLFPVAGDNGPNYIDEGIVYVFPELLENEKLVSPLLTFIGVLAESSGYARDSILCMELHKTLCELAKAASEDESICLLSCEAIRKIFAYPADIDFQILSDSVPSVIELLDLPIISCVHSIISALTQMGVKMSTLVITFHEYGLYSKVITFVQTPDLTDVSLKLIGLLSIGQPSHVKSMLDEGVFPILMSLIESEYAADVFWIFSNLIETLQNSVMDLFNLEFVAGVVELAQKSSFEVKKEIAFFLSTLSLFVGGDVLNQFLNEDVVDILVEMLGCGVSYIMLRIVDAIIRMLHQVQNGSAPNDFISILEQSDLRKRINDIDQFPSIIIQRSQYLIELLDAIENPEEE